MLEEYKREYINKNIQFLFVDFNGQVVAADKGFMPAKAGAKISDLHPFFELVPFVEFTEASEESFHCVHLAVSGSAYITDIRLRRQDEGILIIIHDFTEQYNDHQAVAQARNESIINSELIVLKNKELEEREYFKNRFIQNFSHELRNPLTSIISITNLLAKTHLSDEQKAMLSFLMDSNTNLKLMLDDILNLSLINSGKLVLQRKIFSLQKLLEFLAFTYQAKANEIGLDFELHVDNKIPEFVEGDRLRLFQILNNLLDNAIKYTQEGKVLLIVRFNQQRANKVSLRFEVEDTGIGISEEDQVRIYDSFSRLNDGDRQQGVGLGLSIAKGLLDLMGSEIKMKSTMGEGTSFYFDISLPFPLLKKNKSPMAKEKKGKGKVRVTEGHKFKVLLVEDDERVQMALFKTLADTGHFYIDLVNDGSKAMEEVVNSSYDLIIMDINLPNITGDQLTKLIRDFPFKQVKKIPVIGLTAHAYKADIKNYREAGMNAVLTKPYDENQLLDTVYKWLKK